MNKTNTSLTLIRRAIGTLQLALALLAIYFLTRAVIAVFAPESLWQAPPPSAGLNAQSGQTVQTARLDTGFDPFHRETTAIDEVIEIGTNAPETTLNLKLFGRRAGANGSAILETPDRKQRVFRIGDEIMNGVVLKAVNPDHIVLSQGGRIERLTFERESTTMPIKPEEEETLTQQTPAEVPVTTVPAEITIENFIAGVNLSPSVSDGTLQGFSLSPKNNTIDLKALGLVSGDVVAAIEDINLTSPNLNPADIATKLSGRSNVQLTVLRGGKTIYVNLGR